MPESITLKVIGSLSIEREGSDLNAEDEDRETNGRDVEERKIIGSVSVEGE